MIHSEMKRTASLLLHPFFLVSLFVLLANDLSWKSAYPNWLTGKLSDVVGLVVLPVFLTVFFPAHKTFHLLFSALFFVWWKSSLSGPVIHFFNEQLSLPIGRTVDYTDLFALAILPLAGRIKPVSYNLQATLQAGLRTALAVITFVSLCSTSVPYREGLGYGRRENEMGFYEHFQSAKTEEELVQGLKDKGLAVYREEVRYYPVRNGDNLYYGLSSPNDSTVSWTPVPHSKDSAIYLRRVSTPFYVIPYYVLDGDTLKNIEFTISTNNKKKKRSTIYLESFQTARPEKYRDFYYGKQRKLYRKQFEKLF